tara:strand:+ start:926 stop:1582 length:657 start_codon:yes stop_codon:yes gene_type:complete
MSAVPGHQGFVFEPITWQPEVLARLNDRHLVAWGDDISVRSRFAASFQQYLSSMPDTQVCVIHGRAIQTLDDLCDQLERLIPVDKLSRSVDGPWGISSLLRQRSTVPGRRSERMRVFVWHDADLLVRRNRALFQVIAEVMAGVSAEMEYADDGAVLVQRCVYVGSPAIEREARRVDSRLNSWGGSVSGEIPFWELVSGQATPRTTLCSIERLLADSGC